MEQINVVNDTQRAVVVPDNSSPANGAAADMTDACGNTEPATRTQTARENSGFRKMRLENERYKRELDELRAQMSEYSKLKAQSERYLGELVRGRMEADLESIRKMDPTVSSLESLGDDFLRLVENGIDAAVAFAAVRRATEGKAIPKPPATGAVKRGESAKTRYYSSKELDRLTAKDLENPKVFKKALESLKML